MNLNRPKIAETFIDPSATLREATVGRCCEILQRTHVEYAALGDYSYLGPDCMVSDAAIGRFCAIAARLARIAWFETTVQRLADFRSVDIEAFCDRWDPELRAS